MAQFAPHRVKEGVKIEEVVRVNENIAPGSLGQQHLDKPGLCSRMALVVADEIIIIRSWAEPPDHADEQRARTTQDDEEQKDSADNLNRT